MKCKFEHGGYCYEFDSPQFLEKCEDSLCGCSAPITNADRIRAMSDEELAEFLIDLADDGNLKIREWLQQPAEEVEHETD